MSDTTTPDTLGAGEIGDIWDAADAGLTVAQIAVRVECSEDKVVRYLADPRRATRSDLNARTTARSSQHTERAGQRAHSWRTRRH